MQSNYFLGTSIQSIQSSGNSSQSAGSGAVFARVNKIVLDDTVVLFDSRGVKLPIGGISYKLILDGDDSDDTLGTALPMFSNIQQYPQENEVIMLIQAPDTDSQGTNLTTSTYYLNSGVLSIWGSPHHNALPQQDVDFNNPIGKGVTELSNINQLYPFPGDTILQGRLGQSIRMSGYKSEQNTLTDASNNAQPMLLIRNGQIKTTNGLDSIVENINQDANSIYFLSDHKVPLTPANTKRDSYNEVPTISDQFKGNQVVINGGRLYFNAKEESAFISAKQSIGLNANTINLDATDYFCVDAKKIYIGVKARTATASVQQPAVLGKQMENWLGALLDALDLVATAMSSASAVGAGPVTQLNSTGPILKATVQSLKTRFTLFQSKKVFIE
jgi:hypothetical protein